MTPQVAGLLLSLISAGAIWALAALVRPRRGVDRQGRRSRIMLTLGALAPGLWLAVTGQAVAFLIWIGSAAILGWVIAMLYRVRVPPDWR